MNVIGVRDGVATAHGLYVPTQPADLAMAARFRDRAAIGAKTTHALPDALSHPDISATGQQIRAWQSHGTLTAAVCTGTFVLAENGLLDGQVATTSW